MDTSSDTQNTLIKLNVGGKKYLITKSTILSHPNSMLAAMISKEKPAIVDEEGYYFIDRNGELFEVIIEYLRTSGLYIPRYFRNKLDISNLLREAAYYGLDNLTNVLGEYSRDNPNIPNSISKDDDENGDIVSLPFTIGVSSNKNLHNFTLRRCINCRELYFDTDNRPLACSKPKRRKGDKTENTHGVHVDEGYSAPVKGIQVDITKGYFVSS